MRGTVTNVSSVDTPLRVIDKGTLPWPKYVKILASVPPGMADTRIKPTASPVSKPTRWLIATATNGMTNRCPASATRKDRGRRRTWLNWLGINLAPMASMKVVS